MKKYYLLLLLICCAGFTYAQSSLSGIVNIYASLIQQDDCNNSITIDDAAAFNAGMGVVIFQARGANINLGNNPSYGSIDALNGAGHYEYNRILSVVGNQLNLEYGIRHTYTPAFTQVVGFDIYDTASVDGTVMATPYNGSTGGILVIETENTLSLNADITASETGFAGGITLNPLDNNCNFLTGANNYFYDTNNWRGAPKGEGITLLMDSNTSGRGAPANGGGGGNDHNSGGGGGALLSAGGQGGENNEPSTFGCDGDFPGLGGNALPNEADRIFMGGGGGSGHTNNLAVSGGRGGGIIIIKAGDIQVNSGSINTNGQDGQNTNGDGGGGGGAGGMLILLADNISGNLSLNDNGGKGGTVNNSGDPRCFGPGGGGSGGAFLTNTSLTAQTNGGAAGLSVNSAECSDSPNGATAGAAGNNSIFNTLPQGPLFAAPTLLSFSSDTTLCENQTVDFSLILNNEDATYQWQLLDPITGTWEDIAETPTTMNTQTASFSLTASASSGGDYRVLITPSNSCFAPFTSPAINLEVIAAPSASPSFSLIGNTANFIANLNAPTSSISWDFGGGNTSTETDPSFTFSGPGTYPVSVTFTNSCGSFTDELTVVITAPIMANIGSSTLSGCAPLVVLFEDLSVGEVVNRMWTFTGGTPASSTDASPVVTFPDIGTYEVTLDVDNGVNSSSSNVTISAITPPIPIFAVETNGLMVSINNMSSNATSYFWDFGDSNTSTLQNPTHTYSTPGVYEISLNANNASCGVANSQSVSVFTSSSTEAVDWQPKLFPNPVQEVLQIERAAGSQLHIWTSSGQLLRSISLNSNKANVDLRTLNSGLYLLQFERDSLQYWERLVKL